MIPIMITLTSQQEMGRFLDKVKMAEYQRLSSDPYANAMSYLHVDPKDGPFIGPSDADSFILTDWASGHCHTVECFDDEGPGRDMAVGLLRLAGVSHYYKCV